MDPRAESERDGEGKKKKERERETHTRKGEEVGDSDAEGTFVDIDRTRQ